MKNKIFFVIFIGLALGLSACATNGNMPRPMIIDNSPPTSVNNKADTATTNPTTPKPFTVDMLEEKPAALPPSAPAAPSMSAATTSLENRVASMEKQVKTNTKVLGTTQKLAIGNQGRIAWLERYQRQMDAKLANLTWNGGGQLAPIRIGNFASGSAALTKQLAAQADRSAKRLKQISAEVKATGKNLAIKILGYASPGGSAKKNKALSLERAKAIAKILKKGGLKIVAVEGKGEIRAAFYSDTNRCVRIISIIK